MERELLCDKGYVAQKLGVTAWAVKNWTDAPTAAFPMPAEWLRYGDQQSRTQPLWRESQIPLLRDWLAQRLCLSNPGEYWARIDRGLAVPGEHTDQEPLFP